MAIDRVSTRLRIILKMTCIWGAFVLASNFCTGGRLSSGRLLADDGGISISVNGILMDDGDVLLMDNGRVMIPLRSVVGYLNGKISWYPNEQQVIGFRGARGFDLIIGAARAHLSDGTICNLDVPAKIFEGRAYVPLRFISVAFGCGVEWDDTTRTAAITTSRIESETELKGLVLPVLLKIETDKSSCSGFFFSKDGQIVTSAAIVKDASWIRVKTNAGTEYQAEKITVDTKLDLAKLRINKASGETFPVFRYFDDFNGVEAGEAVYAFASPHVTNTPMAPGKIREKAAEQEDRGGICTYTVSATFTAESSGGPLVKENGALLGVLCFREKDGTIEAYGIPTENLFSMRNR